MAETRYKSMIVSELSESMKDMHKMMDGALSDLNERTIALINYKGFYETIKGACELYHDHSIDSKRLADYVVEKIDSFIRQGLEYNIKWRYEK